MKLRKLCLKDAPFMLEWMHDTSINRFFKFDAMKMSLQDVECFIEKSWEEYAQGTNYHLAIVNDSDEYLGTISLKNVDCVSRNAEYAICLRSCAQGSGTAAEATKEILSFAFNELQLYKVYLNVLSINHRAIQFYEKYGFIFEGEFRECLNINGAMHSLKWYAIFRNTLKDMNYRTDEEGIYG